MFTSISLDTLFTGQSIIFLPSCHSTNDYAASLLTVSGTFEGTVVVTSNQTGGRGQRGSSWESEPGKNLTCSVVFMPHFLDIDASFLLNLAVSLAVHDTLTHFLEKKINIKWPNDIYCSGKKICGILIETSIQGKRIRNAIVGIGININQTSFQSAYASSMNMLAEKEFRPELVLRELLERLEKFYLRLKAGDSDKLLQEYTEKLYGLGEERYFCSDHTFKGIIRGIDEVGRLRLEVNGVEKVFALKEVSFVHARYMPGNR